MVDQSLVQSGFDVEVLLSEGYIKHFLLTSMETGSIAWWTQSTEDGVTDTTIVHAPEALQEIRLYAPHLEFTPHPFSDLVSTSYTPNPNAFAVELLPADNPADLRVQAVVSVVRQTGSALPFVLEEQLIHLDLRFFISTDANQRNVSLNLQLVDIGGPLIQVGESLPPQFGFDKTKIFNRLKAQLDRRVPLNLVGANGAVQRIEMKKFLAEDDHPAAIGLYLNLRLKNGPGPEDFFPDRGDANEARNFLPTDEHLAFAFDASLYGRLAADIRHRLAEPKPEAPGEFHYPIRDGEDIVGKIVGANVYPEFTGTAWSNVLVIDVEGEFYIDNMIDPNFHMRVRLEPRLENHVLTWETDFDLDVPALAYIVVSTVLLSFVFPKAFPLAIAALAAKTIIERTGESIAVPIIEGELEDASLFDAFPNNLTIEERRWDPTYSTLHQVVSLVNGVQINDRGLAFSAFDLRIGKKPKPLASAAIRSEVRDESGAVVGLLYRVADWNPNAPEATAIYPAVDRMPHEGIIAPTGVERRRVHLTLEQVQERIAAGKLLAPLPYTPYKIDEQAGQIYQILTLCTNEIADIRGEASRLLRAELEQQRRAEFETQAHDALAAELGREPTADELRERYNQILGAALAAGLDQRYRALRESYLRFDLEPSEYAQLQSQGVLKLEHHGLMIVTLRQGADGPTVYYRDRPDSDEGDNLLFLPRYRSEPIARA